MSQLGRSDPGQIVALNGTRLAPEQGATEEVKLDRLERVFMHTLMEELMNLNLYPELFAQFPLQALGQGLTGILFSPGHLP
ncbi:MAG: hypothetical protein PHI67_09885 [Candidatus Methanomethylophilaceae archaeon]|nr:hypothetical protein [Candidatus Methanomethylophilaceae archaeon]